jgi:hypothetical protein
VEVKFHPNWIAKPDSLHQPQQVIRDIALLQRI